MKTTYSIEVLANGGWEITIRDIPLREAACREARRLAKRERRTHHVYMLTRTGKRKHVFAARVLEDR